MSNGGLLSSASSTHCWNCWEVALAGHARAPSWRGLAPVPTRRSVLASKKSTLWASATSVIRSRPLGLGLYQSERPFVCHWGAVDSTVNIGIGPHGFHEFDIHGDPVSIAVGIDGFCWHEESSGRTPTTTSSRKTLARPGRARVTTDAHESAGAVTRVCRASGSWSQSR